MSTMVVGDSGGLPFGLLEELMKQLKVGAKNRGKGVTVDQLRAFLEHRNPFDLAEISAVLPYADERVESTFGYPEGFIFRTPEEQVLSLLQIFPALDASKVPSLVPKIHHELAEFTPVIPKWQSIAKTYGEALLLVVAKLKLLHGDKFKNYREDKLTDEYVRLVEKTRLVYQQLTSNQKGDFLVFDAQFGKRWAGASVRHGQERYLKEEFGLGPYETGILLLTHPDRVTGNNQLYIECAGIEYRDNPKGLFSLCLYFRWGGVDQPLELLYRRIDDRYERWGLVSGFRPQCETGSL